MAKKTKQQRRRLRRVDERASPTPAPASSSSLPPIPAQTSQYTAPHTAKSKRQRKRRPKTTLSRHHQLTPTERQQATSHNLTIPFLKLPSELRNAVYAMVLEGKTYRLNAQGRAYNNRGRNILALLRTCWQIRFETRSLHLTLNTVQINGGTTMVDYLFNPSNAHQTSLITKLDWHFRVQSHIGGAKPDFSLYTDECEWQSWAKACMSRAYLPQLCTLRVLVKMHFCICGTRDAKPEDVIAASNDEAERVKVLISKSLDHGFKGVKDKFVYEVRVNTSFSEHCSWAVVL
jgi:hypothetical protein